MNSRPLFSTSIAASLCATFLSACSSITGLDASSHYACKAPDGIRCDSLAGNYYNAIQNNLPSKHKSTAGNSQPAAARPPIGASVVPTTMPTGSAAHVAAPLRESPQILRLWIKSWEDSDRDLNGESVVYVRVDDGHWLLDHVQRQSRQAFAPVRSAKPVPPESATPSIAPSQSMPVPLKAPPSTAPSLRSRLGSIDAPAGNSSGN